MNPLLVFIHIPKTGGTTLTNIIDAQYQNNVHYDVYKYDVEASGVRALGATLQEADTLTGHFLYGVHQYIARPCDYITLLRSPVEQVLSWFHIRYKSEFYDQYEGTIDDYLDDADFDYENVNLQTRFLCGNILSANVDEAKYHLKHAMRSFGILESFPESLALMRQTFQWQDTSFSKANMNTARPRREDFTRTTITKIERKYAMDIELYEFAVRLFAEKIRLL